MASMQNVPTILCIDDDCETLNVRRHFLQSCGYSVVSALSGKDAFKVISSGKAIDLVLLDYMMPGMNGDDVAYKLKEKYPQLPVVLVSAIAQLPERLVKNIDGYVQKGQDPEVLISAVARFLRPRDDNRKAEAMQVSNHEQKTVLCAEDDEDQLTSRKWVLESAGFQVLLARSGTEALQVFRDRAVDAVILDYWMPGMKGVSVAREMKQLRPNTPIIVLSGFSALPDETIGIVDAWLQKREVEPAELLSEVTRLIQRSSTSSHD
jgi:CheY-like chemotaxis protein